MDALALRGDKGRDMAAKSLGESPNRLRPGDFRMGKPDPMDHPAREANSGN